MKINKINKLLNFFRLEIDIEISDGEMGIVINRIDKEWTIPHHIALCAITPERVIPTVEEKKTVGNYKERFEKMIY